MQGILLIGMPGAGKSSLGKKIAEILGFSFFDEDTEIEKKHPDRRSFLDSRGDDAYIEMEGEVISRLPVKDSVLSPGGSMIYSQKCKRYLQGCFKVFLDASLETIRKRLTDSDRRGIVRLKEIGLESLYMEREKLYRGYADLAIEVEGKSDDELAKAIVAAYKKHQKGK